MSGEQSGFIPTSDLPAAHSTKFAVTQSLVHLTSVNPAGDTAEIPELPYQGDKSHVSQLSGQTPRFTPFIIFGMVPQFPSPLPIKITNRSSITTSLSS